jgi:putative Mn2+ efflux pump MntP
MTSILLSGLALSILHAVIPNHWIPLVTLSKKEQWNLPKTLKVTALAGGAHVLSTVIIGILISILSFQLSQEFEKWTRWISPALLVALGLYFIYQHYHHRHFHINPAGRQKSIRHQIKVIVIAMFFSPCLEIEALYIMAGQHSWELMFWLSLLYVVVTLIGMLIWVYIVYQGLEKLNRNWHGLEHSSGIIAGVILIVTGLLSFFLDFH